MVLPSLRTTIVLALFLGLSSALIHDLKIKHDNRVRYFIENFGFAAGGHIRLDTANFTINGKTEGELSSHPVCFVIKKTETDSATFLKETDNVQCLCDPELNIPSMDVWHPARWASDTWNKTIPVDGDGFYNIYFVNCITEDKTISYNLLLTMYNEGGKFLSIGQMPLPTLYSVMFVVYFGMLLLWLLYFMRIPGVQKFLIHYLMAGLVALKMFALLFHAIDFHYLNLQGYAGGWAVVYYSFTFLKGMMLFTVIALIGTGWSFIKPFLSEKDKKIFLVVIPLQILDNIALVIIEETTPGSQGWFTWKDIFRLVDIICCGAILIPIIWSIKHLRDAAQIDGKAARNIMKLKLFRQYYLIVVSYIYFTRIIVYLFDATLPFHLVWLGDLCTELAALAFFSVTGYKFRPVENNPFLTVREEDVEAEDGIPMKELEEPVS